MVNPHQHRWAGEAIQPSENIECATTLRLEDVQNPGTTVVRETTTTRQAVEFREDIRLRVMLPRPFRVRLRPGMAEAERPGMGLQRHPESELEERDKP